MIPTRLTSLLEIRYPVIQGGMVWVADWRLASAVSNAGGLGVLGSGSMDLETLRWNIGKMREETDRPWGVNIPLLRRDVEAAVSLCLEERVGIFTTSAGDPARVAPLLRAGRAKVRILHVVPNVRGAVRARDAGYDAVVCEGYEAGGHNGMDELGTLALVPQVADAVDLPVVAAGGIADGRGIAAALALGADGVQMGTRFIATAECGAHEAFKQKLVEAPDTGTLITGRGFNMMLRCLKNEYSLWLAEKERRIPDREAFLNLVAKERNRAESGMIKGDVSQGILEAGQSAGLVRSVPPVAELFRELERQYHEVVDGLRPGGRTGRRNRR
ncbi:MAG: nitronate monooxygenase [Deltaproteobacteria bacterium]|nr:nitronate monooxygenase [Deltaproteobacteria bacterium]MBW1922842.1 nitronate monooxygenase [Deltaproteobacteria bacterium]MBW1948233.1 nitronate monooxygenase [Deltaproteobacteria bacterium]MBW2006579.1 nitronate monooxygenase [Deltaproteobacteria bacterium]MBW2101441.1 nitronate monooxygenase [Deltaproteobacteria bacterium]